MVNVLDQKQILFGPLIHKTSSDASIILTAMTDIKAISKDAGKSISVSTYEHHPSSRNVFMKVVKMVRVEF